MKYEFTLCAGRHQTPASASIFDTEINPIDFAAMSDKVYEVIPADADELIVYVTGLTPAMLAVVCFCERNGISLTAMHYDRESGEYLAQPVLKFVACETCGRRHPAFFELCPFCWGNS